MQYRLPAEWEPQSSLWLTWPQNQETWGERISKVERTYCQIAEAVLNHQDLTILVNDSLTINAVVESLNTSSKRHLIQYFPFSTNDCWIRDYGGITVEDQSGQKKMLNWQFNAWGEKYFPWELDNMVPIIMSKRHGMPLEEIQLVLEGGSIDSNGNGLLLTTDTCLLNPNRNPSHSKEQIEAIVKDKLGIREILWLSGEITGDDTDGHVDEVARFAAPNIVFHAIEENKSDPNYLPLKNMAAQLEAYAKKLSLELVEIPLPKPLMFGEFQAPASYLNFLIINEAVLVPCYGGSMDERILGLFKKYFPNRTIYPIDSSELNFGQGGIHCISMQVPK